MRLLPDGLPGKTRLGRRLLRAFAGWKPAVLADRAGRRFHCPSLEEPVAASLFIFGRYEQETADVIRAHLPRGGVFVDGGANIGSISLPIAADDPAATVVAIEGSPTIMAFLRRNLEANGLGNVRPVQVLLGAEVAEGIPFYVPPDSHFGMGSVGPQFNVEPVFLRQTTLVDVLEAEGLDHVDVLKLDIEGAEPGALRGALPLLSGPRPPVVVFEFSDWAESRIAGQKPGDAQRLLLDLGFRLSVIGGEPLAEPMTEGAAMILAVPG